MAQLSFPLPSGEIQKLELNGGTVSIGRQPDNVVVLDSDSVSGNHAEIVPEDGHFVLRDLRSSNGTTLNAKPTVEARLKDGDRIVFGSIECVFSDPKSNGQEAKAIPSRGAAHPLEHDPASAFGMEDGADLGIKSTVSLFKSLDYGFLLPFRKMFSQGLLKKKAVRWVILFGLMPLAIFQTVVALEMSFTQAIWLLEAYFCLFWALYFHTLVQPGKAIWKRAIGYALFTAFIGIWADIAVQSLPVMRSLYSGAGSDSFIVRLLGNVLGVGLLEETCKAAPLILFGLRSGKIKGVRDGLFLGFMSGLGFAAAEGVTYSFGAATFASRADSSYAEAAFTVQILQTIFRFMSGPLLHGAWAGTVGWFVGLAASRQSPRWPIVVVGIVFMAVLHGINDTVAGTLLHLPVAAASILILMAYLTHGEEPQPDQMKTNPL